MTDVGFYPWVKAFHLLSIIAWMAGMLYLPRLYVYHAEVGPGTPQSETFKIMERRLLRAIVNPAMIATFIFGGWLAWLDSPIIWSSVWFYLKLALVLALTAIHGLFARWRRDFEADRNARPARFYRLMNEVPTLILIAIVILAVVKPL